MDTQDKNDSDKVDRSVTLPELDFTEPPPGSDRRAFMMRSALATAIATLTGRPIASFANVPAQSPKTSVTLDPKLDVVRKSKGPVLTTVEEFYSWPVVGPRLEEWGAVERVEDFVDELPGKFDTDTISRSASAGEAASAAPSKKAASVSGLRAIIRRLRFPGS